MPLKLYDLTEAFLRLLALSEVEEVDPETGEITDPTVGMKAALDTIEMAIDSKIENCAKVVKTLLATATVLKGEEYRLAKRRKSAEASAAWLKTYMRVGMQAAEKKKIKTDLFTIYLAKAQKKLVVEEGANIPENYLKPPKPRDVDLRTLRDALAKGVIVPWARLEDAEPSLNIR